MNSCRKLNQIFYNNKKFDSLKDILLLEKHYLQISKHNDYIAKQNENVEPNIIPISETVKEKNIIVEESTSDNLPSHSLKPTSKDSWFEPLQKDTIFWCVFAFIYGHTEYLMVGSRYGNRELEEKTKMITFFNGSKKQLKNTNHKITNINIQEILSEFLSLQNETTFLGIIGLVTFYKIRILVVDETKKLYLEFAPVDDPDCKTCILYKNTSVKGFIKYRMNMTADTEESYKSIMTNMLRLEHYSKPLRAISSYKVSELEDIAALLGIPTNAKKPELYARISEFCNWK